ncbi:MAG: RDD family protein [Caulobacteraceae bacterium]|nr:RDD family protein [Caulobacteraceae bacterium]
MSAEPVDTRAQRTLITPEGVDLRLKIAEAGQRAGAFLLDIAIILGLLIAMSLLALVGAGLIAGLTGGDAQEGKVPLGVEIAAVIWLLGAFLLRNAYFIAFELSPRAATPGKRVMGIRVAARNGGRLRAESVFARNATRELEFFLPLAVLGAQGSGGENVDGWMWLLAVIWCSVFVLFPLFNRDRLRAGDLIGGTWVVRTPRQTLAPDMAQDGVERTARFPFTLAQLDAYGVKELHVLEDVLRVRERRTMRAVADRICGKIGWTRTDDDDFDFLSAYYAAIRGRLESRLLMGKRRKDKFDAP